MQSKNNSKFYLRLLNPYCFPPLPQALWWTSWMLPWVLTGRVGPIILQLCWHPSFIQRQQYTSLQNIFKSQELLSCRHPDHKQTLCVRSGSWTNFSPTLASAGSFLSISVLSSWNSSLWFIVSACSPELGDVRPVLLLFPLLPQLLLFLHKVCITKS